MGWAARGEKDDEPPPSLAEIMKPWISNHMEASDENRLRWRAGSSRPPASAGYSDSPYIDWSVYYPRPCPARTANPSGRASNLTPPNPKGLHFTASPPWGTVIELSTKEYAPMNKSVAGLFNEWHRTKVTVTMGKVQRREFTVPVTSGWFTSDSVRSCKSGHRCRPHGSRWLDGAATHHQAGSVA